MRKVAEKGLELEEWTFYPQLIVASVINVHSKAQWPSQGTPTVERRLE